MRLLTSLLFPALLFAGDFRVANYNVENIFDLNNNGTEYQQYKPNTQFGWNKKIYKIKLQNISKVIKDLNADIVALQEMESEQALKDLVDTLKNQGVEYKYFAITKKKKKTAVKCAIISKFPIKKVNEVFVSKYSRERNILEATILVENKEFKIFVNHWKSKSGAESKRIRFATALKKRLDKLSKDTDYVIIGDLNSDYNEFETFKNRVKLNDTNGKTGINHKLRTIKENKMITLSQIKDKKFKNYRYNLWMELDKNERWSHNFYGKKGSLDNMIISPALFDGKGISYKEKSFNRFAPKYLFVKKDWIKRWEITKRGKGKHKGVGYSDHLPIYADFKY